MKEYMAVPGPKNVHINKGETQAAMNLFADIINDQAEAGWTYHSMETIAVTEKPGCLQQPITTYYYMLIFYREV
ncbi:DUF4177 domain-containing protein [Paenibacillus campinasensis]|uniref:DUF4177 domain-containing protein n=1 Tax=Paenibacillus campinasensis TaxID=66347 RepID=A0A268ET00_9BACL|nr:DUF4177 domain-containing protein [Paenibacillus campinasensis]PAD76258.1 hypothetical protein CHH67_12900 [Paenibacillus campinasensis]